MPIIKQLKEKEVQQTKENIQKELLSTVSKQSDNFNIEIENLNNQIEASAKEIQEYRKIIQQHDIAESELKNDKDHLKARVMALEKMLQEQSKNLDNYNELEENNASKKADELMNHFKNFLGDSDEEVNNKQIKSKLSNIQDENLQLKETITNLRKEISSLKSGGISNQGKAK